ncbi:hypothetical protein ACINK0_18215 (plasmid) [Deinococcus sp. VB343]|uniref:Uncharacterized protein n=1 Tax=Deinococcus sp. VB142 TaxID=3112952 RepID=A0AAU6Q8T1_9DEIO
MKMKQRKIWIATVLMFGWTAAQAGPLIGSKYSFFSSSFCRESRCIFTGKTETPAAASRFIGFWYYNYVLADGNRITVKRYNTPKIPEIHRAVAEASFTASGTKAEASKVAAKFATLSTGQFISGQRVSSCWNIARRMSQNNKRTGEAILLGSEGPTIGAKCFVHLDGVEGIRIFTNL